MSIETPAPAPAEAVNPAPVTDESTASDTETPIPGAEALGDPGKKALDAMKAERAAAKAEAKAVREEFEAFKAKAEGKEAEYAAEQERRNVESAALAKANERILKAEIRAAAAGKLADPADALKFLDLSVFEVGADGDVDADAVTAAIENLAKSKPYLAAQGGTPGTVLESPGAHRTGPSAGQVTQAELDRMTPDQINAARAKGRLNDLLGIKS
jgi:hypothetical protein